MDPHLDRLFNYLEWANERLMASLEGGPPPDGALRLLAHILGAEQVWLARIRAGARTSPWPDLTLEQCRTLSEANAAGYREVLRAATASGLAAPVHYENLKGEEFWTPLRDILFHVVTHGDHHRGQIAALLRAAGRDPADTNFISFAREEEDPGRYAYLEIPAADLVEALEGNAADVVWQVDLETGEVAPALDNPAAGDVLPVEPLPPRDRFAIMEDFVETLPEGEAARALARALRLPKPFRAFRDTLRDFPALEKPWHTFQEKGMRRLAEDWLEENLPGARLI